MMTTKIWNDVDFGYWYRDYDGDEVEISVNEYGAGPVVLELKNGDDCTSTWMTPAQARELGEKLIEAADATDRAGKVES